MHFLEVLSDGVRVGDDTAALFDHHRYLRQRIEREEFGAALPRAFGDELEAQLLLTKHEAHFAAEGREHEMVQATHDAEDERTRRSRPVTNATRPTQSIVILPRTRLIGLLIGMHSNLLPSS